MTTGDSTLDLRIAGPTDPRHRDIIRMFAKAWNEIATVIAGK